MLVDVMLVLDELVLHELLQVGPLGAQVRQSIHHIQDQVEAVEIILHPHVKGGRDRAFLLVASDVQIAVGAAVGQAVHQPGVTMKAEDDVLVLGKQRVVIHVAESMWMFRTGLQPHQVDDIDHPNPQIGQMLAKDGHGREDLERRRVPATGHDHVRLGILIVAGPWPDPDAFRAVHHRRVHGQPLGQRVLSCHHDVDIVPAAQAVIDDGQQAVGVGRQVHAYDVGLLVDDVVEKTGVLMREAVVVLLPDMRGEQIVQRGDLAPPRQFRGDLQPFGMLAEHRVDDANEGLVAVEEAMPSGQQIALQPTFALVLAEH